MVLINPPSNYALKSVVGLTSPPLGLAYLASIAKEKGFSVSIIDSQAEEFTFRDITSLLKRYDPEVVGVTAVTPMFPDACLTAYIAKKLNPNVLTVVGGPHVTFLPERSLIECPYIDVVVRGEGERIFGSLLKSVEAGRDLKSIPGLTYRVDGRIKSNPPELPIKEIDSLPIPSYDLLPMEKYKVGKKKFGTIITSRGCPYNCVFCSSSQLFGHAFRAHSVDRVIEELSILRNEFGVDEIEFLDDTFTLNKRRAREIAKRIIEEDLDISWSASSRVNTIDFETALSMRKSGAHTVYFGIESATEKVLRFIGKGITTRQAKRAVEIAKKAGLNVLGSFVIGFPIEKKEDIEATINFAKKLDLDYAQFTIATPYPGTRLWEYAISKGLLLTTNWRKYTTTNTVMKSLYLSTQQIKRLLIKAYVSFYLRIKYIVRDIAERGGYLTLRAIYQTLKYIFDRLLK